MNDPPIPVTVLTGFLGSGKTTFLNHILKEEAMAGTAIVVNEFGEIGLDHLALEPLDGETVVMASGCLCCTIREDLAVTLISLKERRDAGTMPPFNRVVIETTGLADPAPIAQLLLTHPDIIDAFVYLGLVSTHDGCIGLAQLRDTPECAKQVAMADTVIITKTDLAQSRPKDLAAAVNLLNPGVRLVEDHAAGAPLLSHPAGPTLLDHRAFADLAHDTEPNHEQDHDHRQNIEEHDVNRHGPSIRALSLLIDEPQEWLTISMWLSFVISTHGEYLLRLKGIIAIQGQPGPAVVNGVRHVFHEPEHLAVWPDEDRRTRLVFIVRDLDPDLILASWREFTRAA